MLSSSAVQHWQLTPSTQWSTGSCSYSCAGYSRCWARLQRQCRLGHPSPSSILRAGLAMKVLPAAQTVLCLQACMVTSTTAWVIGGQ